MRYFIGYLLSGDAKRYHENLTEEIADKFGVPPLNRRIPPHITLKVPFETDRIEDVEEALKEYAQNHSIAPLTLSGFHHFNQKVIFIDVSPSKQMLNDVRELMSVLQSISWMQFDRHDVQKKLHATVAYPKNYFQFGKMWKFVGKREAVFDVSFDNVAILKKEDRKWLVHKEYPLCA